MTDLHLGFRLDFSTPLARERSEKILLRVMGVNSLANLYYLMDHPDTPALYDSHVVYTKPDQSDGRPPLKRSTIKKVIEILRDEAKLDPETALMIVRMMKGIEIFLDIPTLYRRGKGDCNELVPVRLAELWRKGVLASPYLTWEQKPGGGVAYHAIIFHEDGSSEDPSAILGMGGPENADARREEIRKNVERRGMLENVAVQLIENGGAMPEALRKHIDDMGFVPPDGVFRSPFRKSE